MIHYTTEAPRCCTAENTSVEFGCDRSKVKMSGTGILFEDIFNVKDIDPDGKKFDRGKFISYIHFYKFFMHTCLLDELICKSQLAGRDTCPASTC